MTLPGDLDQPQPPTNIENLWTKFYHLQILLCPILSIILVVLILAYPSKITPNEFIIYSLLFSSVGAILRKYLCQYFNQPKFAYGTFISNLLAIIVLISLKSYTDTGSSVIRGLMTGFCGCLSTVSSMIKDVVNFYTKTSKLSGVIYILTTLVSAGLISYFWLRYA